MKMVEKKEKTGAQGASHGASHNAVEKAKKPNEARDAKKNMTDAKAKKNMMMLIAVCAAVAVAIVVLAIALSTGAPKSPQADSGANVITNQQNGTPGTKLSDLMSRSIVALSSVKHAKVQAAITMDMKSTTAQESQNVKIGLDASALYDVSNKRIYVSAKRTSTDVPGAGVTDEMYLINDTQYSKIAVGERVLWIKQKSLVDPWSTFDMNSIMQVLGAVNGNVAGVETVGGKAADKIRIEPDVRGLVDQLMASQYSQMMAAGATEADVQGVADMIVKAVKRVDAYIWVDKATSLPIKLQGEVQISLDLQELTGIPGAGTSEMLMKIDITADYDAPVDVRLSVGASGAMGIEDAYAALMEPYCGDGMCSGNETYAGCPGDCEAAANGSGADDIESDLIELT